MVAPENVGAVHTLELVAQADEFHELVYQEPKDGLVRLDGTLTVARV
jgi:hypothetical protein